MSEQKFKVGDVVKSVSGNNWDKEWDNVTITEIREDLGSIWGYQNGKGSLGSFNPKQLELVNKIDSPIKEVTTKTIVPGNYGKVHVGHYSSKEKTVVGICGNPIWAVGLTAKEIRKAIKTLTEIADWMEEK